MFQQAFKTIIVGVDFSDYSKIVVKQAKFLCKLWNTKLVLVHAMTEPVSYEPTLYSLPVALFFDPKHYQRRILKTYAINESEVEIYTEPDVPSSLLKSVAETYPQCLIMVGSVGMSGLARLIFGSTAQSMALSSKFPVWIHRGEKVINPKRIMIPHDLTAKSNPSLDLLKQLSLLEPSSAEIFYVQDKVFPVLDYKSYVKLQNKVMTDTTGKISQILKNYRSIPVVIRSGEVTEKVLKRTRKFDLLVMTHHSPSGLFTVSQTAELLKKIKTPVLIISEKS